MAFKLLRASDFFIGNFQSTDLPNRMDVKPMSYIINKMIKSAFIYDIYEQPLMVTIFFVGVIMNSTKTVINVMRQYHQK
jgi:hypothetical protein